MQNSFHGKEKPLHNIKPSEEHSLGGRHITVTRDAFTRGLLEEKNRMLQTTEQELDKYIREQLSESPLGSPGYFPSPHEPTSHFDTSPPKWSEVNQLVKWARAESAPGVNGVPYWVYKVLRLLWKLMDSAWKTQSAPPPPPHHGEELSPLSHKKKTPATSANSVASPC